MKRLKRALGVVACGLALSGPAQAAMLTAGPVPVLEIGANPRNDTYCQVINKGTHAVEVSIRAKNSLGLTEDVKTVTLAPEQGASLYGGNDVAVCTFTAASNRIAGMLLNVDPNTGYYSTAVLAE